MFPNRHSRHSWEPPGRRSGAVREATRVLQILDRTIPTGAITVTTADRLAAIADHALGR
ncbi:hypothetical protein ACR6C2_04110 [Streptomyces sp. INA 01156]